MSVSILTGDCRDVMAQMPSESVDMILADPPYAQTALRWDRRVLGWMKEAKRILKPNGTLWVFGSLKSFLAMSEEFSGWLVVQDLVWEKQNGSGFDAERFRRVHEQVVQFRKAGSRWAQVYRCPQFTMDAKKRSVNAKATRAPHTGRIGAHIYATEEGGPRMVRSVIRARNGHRQGFGHATPKPVDLLQRIIAYSCPPLGVMLDPFGGSGSSGVAASLEQRRAILIEINPEFVVTAQRRLATESPLAKVAA